MENRRQRVCVNQARSSWREVTSSVVQGSCLGPLLFIIFINDMPEVVKNIIKLFADDSKLIAQIKNIKDRESVQDDLNALVKWSEDWKMSFNFEKCKTMQIGKPKCLNKTNEVSTTLKFHMTNYNTGIQHELIETTKERDLGIIISNDLKWSEQSNHAALIANFMLGKLKRSFKNWNKFTFKTLYTAYVRPHLEYATSAWCPYRQKDIKTLEKVQRRATKLVPAVKHLKYTERLRLLDLTTLADRRIRGDAIQHFKIKNDFNKVEWYHPNALTNSLKTDGPARGIRGRDDRLVKQLTKNCAQRDNFFANRTVSVWNSLPINVTDANTVNKFKRNYDQIKKK